ncbi:MULTISPECIES: AraC family transcriptional regulator [unclassified Streptomyces]|jgi:AraC-like DNA-binding protein/quercetin dioxygenase-like cupin family protein|uniref:AraC family transcriptional regulator n=1 Tax=unclassified Streptomyces TaxID=2593676 RepID=UPI000F4D365F|nr:MULTISPECIES: AraC family transcriptional regulator [unclassified Streptomyces]MDH6502678.1 AraC-like DNA-binding protein/quercetin dioxygenase-like cupin family protein [Streptomyces sp. SAI-149]QUC59105.1 AraC family transcriptional regulator [Streptomyces sp. A2-16]GLP66279.1 transcriptional regulator [Streptomyces sp. TUS-ST3]
MGRSPLASHVLCRDSGFEDFRERLNDLFYPAEVTPLSGPEGPGGELRGTRTEHITVGLMTFGQRTRVDPGRTPSHYHVNIVLRGAIEAATGRQEMVATAGDAMVFTPTQQHRLLSCAHGEQHLGIKIDRSLVEAELEALLGRTLQAPLEFAFDFDLATAPGRSWRSTLDLLLAESDNTSGLIGRRPVQQHFERVLVSGLLLAQTHNYTEALLRPQPPAYPRTVRKAVDLIEAHPETPFTVGDLARAAGVSVRRLQEGFREHLGVTPLTYLRNVRLDRVHADLLTGATGVTEAAGRWGFSHLSRFSAAYRERFGAAPSETLAGSGGRSLGKRGNRG